MNEVNEIISLPEGGEVLLSIIRILLKLLLNVNLIDKLSFKYLYFMPFILYQLSRFSNLF